MLVTEKLKRLLNEKDFNLLLLFMEDLQILKFDTFILKPFYIITLKNRYNLKKQEFNVFDLIEKIRNDTIYEELTILE